MTEIAEAPPSGRASHPEAQASGPKKPHHQPLAPRRYRAEPAAKHEESEFRGVYGRRKMNALLRQLGRSVGRDQTEQLMRVAGIRMVRRSKRLFTTKADPHQALSDDPVKRRFTAQGPRKLWVAEVTYVATWSGLAYVAFIIDVYSRRIVGWNVASTLKADILPLRALDMAECADDGNLAG